MSLQTTQIDVQDVEPVEAPIPGGDPPVEVRRLHLDEQGGPISVVRFPAGWSRPGTGAYEVIEEVLWLAGGFTMSGQHHAPGTYTWFPAWYVRHGSSAPDGALAFAWFSGRPGWHTEDLQSPQRDPIVLPWREAPSQPGPLEQREARLLNPFAGGHATWVLEQLPAGKPAAVPVQLYSLPQRRFASVAVGEPLPDLAGPVYCRTFGTSQAS